MNTGIHLYDRIRVLTARFDANGVSVGLEGYVVDEYGDGCLEIEFSNPDGSTFAQIVARRVDLQLVEE